MSKRRIFELYCLRRADKQDPFNPKLWQPFYIGRGKCKRKYDHRKEAERILSNPDSPNTNYVRNNIIHYLWRNGIDWVEETLWVELNNDEANVLEQEFIELYGRKNNGTGCLSNLTDGGEGTSGYTHTEEWLRENGKRTKLLWKDPIYRERVIKGFSEYIPTEEHKLNLSIASKGKSKSNEHKHSMSKERMERFSNPENHPMYKKHHSKETKKYLSTINSGENHPQYGIPHSEERLQKTSGENHWNYGKHWPEEVRNKMSESHKGKSPPNKGKVMSEEQRLQEN